MVSFRALSAFACGAQTATAMIPPSKSAPMDRELRTWEPPSKPLFRFLHTHVVSIHSLIELIQIFVSGSHSTVRTLIGFKSALLRIFELDKENPLAPFSRHNCRGVPFPACRHLRIDHIVELVAH